MHPYKMQLILGDFVRQRHQAFGTFITKYNLIDDKKCQFDIMQFTFIATKAVDIFYAYLKTHRK